MRSKRAVLAFVLLVLAGLAAVLFWLYPRHTPPVPTTLVPADWSAARVSPMHEAHVGGHKIECTKCHTNGFAESPGTSGCASCHAEEDKRAHLGSAAKPTTCLTCHVFAANAQAAACTSCHVGGMKGGPKDEHGLSLAAHKTERATCTSCHSLHGKARTRVDARAECTSCHAVRVVHGRLLAGASDAGVTDASAVAFASGSASGGDAGPRALALRDVLPDAGHSATAGATVAMCTTCHAPHTVVTSCGSCHAPKTAKPHEACVTCHVPHLATKADTRSCESCHGGKKPSLGHTACTSCHTPHAATRASSTCASCHAGVSALASTVVKEHAACTSCHEPHARPGATPVPASAACAKCHADVHPSHPNVGDTKGQATQGSSCIGCHAPHPKAPRQLASACSSCHKGAADDRAFHVAANANANTKHVECKECHKPHAFVLGNASGTVGTLGPALCAQCHAKAAAGVRKDHAACASCHGAAHSPNPKPGCQSCHSAETSTAPRGHSNCTSCHDAHSGSLAKVTRGAPAAPGAGGAGGAGTCATCHAAKSNALHGQLAGAGCATCHRPHGPKGVASPPTCVSCHAPAKLPGLHAVGAHAANCASCHTTHAPPHADRATCTTGCHQKRRAHQPEAAVCTGCHVFRK